MVLSKLWEKRWKGRRRLWKGPFLQCGGGKAAGDIIVDVVVGGGSGLGRRASCVRGEESGV